MTFDLAFVTEVFAALFAIMNPFVDLPVFLTLTEGAGPGVRRRMALIATIATAVGCMIAVVLGRGGIRPSSAVGGP